MSLKKKEFENLVDKLGIKLSEEGKQQIKNTYKIVDFTYFSEKDVKCINQGYLNFLSTKIKDKHIASVLSELVYANAEL